MAKTSAKQVQQCTDSAPGLLHRSDATIHGVAGFDIDRDFG